MTTPIEEDPLRDLRVRLHPFLHQVSGSSVMFKFDGNTVCKPLLPKEYNFYKFLPESLREFTAEYKGSIEIQAEEASDGTVTFYGIVPASKIPSLNLETHKTVFGSSRRPGNCVDYLKEDELRLKRSGSIEIDCESLDSYDNPANKVETSTRLNKRLAKDMLDKTSKHANKFILLENLVSGFERPSILDLKMGTRTHGDDDSENKKARKRAKCGNSTSKSLGVRLHGMQKYNNENGKYETLSKYDGRGMTDDAFKSTMKKFLFDGSRLRTHLASAIYKRLTDFYQCVSQQDTFRFYSSSLLIIYDGSEASGAPASVDVRAIDFAHTTHESSPHAVQSDVHVGPDKGYLLGIQTLIDTFKDMVPE